MTILKAEYTESQLIKLRVRDIDFNIPLTASILQLGWGETWANETISCSVAEYDNNDFLCLSASIYGSESTTARMQVFQVSGSVADYVLLYQGNLRFTNDKPTVLDSKPFYSYPDTKTEYIIYE